MIFFWRPQGVFIDLIIVRTLKYHKIASISESQFFLTKYYWRGLEECSWALGSLHNWYLRNNCLKCVKNRKTAKISLKVRFWPWTLNFELHMEEIILVYHYLSKLSRLDQLETPKGVYWPHRSPSVTCSKIVLALI